MYCSLILDPRTLLFVSSTCGTVFQQIVWIFPPSRHSSEQSNRLILRHFYLVSKLRFTGLLLVPLRSLLIHSHIVCILCSRTAVSSTCNIVCENEMMMIIIMITITTLFQSQSNCYEG